MHGKAPIIVTAISLIATVPYSASAAPPIDIAGLTAAAERLSPVESIHYYGYYGRGYGRGYYGRGYGYGRGYYGYGRGYYGYGRGYYGGYGRGYYGYRYY